MAANVSKPINTWSGWNPGMMTGMHIYVDGTNISASSWVAQYGSGSFANYGTTPTIVLINGINGNAFNISSNASMMTKNIGDISGNGFAYGCLCYSNTAQEWKNPAALTRYFDPADKFFSRIETGGGFTSTYSGESVSLGSVAGDLNDSQWHFVSSRGGGANGSTFMRNGVISNGGAYNEPETFNRMNLGCHYKNTRNFTGVVAMAFFCTADPGVYDLQRLEKWVADRFSLTGRLAASQWFKTRPLLTKRLFWGTEMFKNI